MESNVVRPAQFAEQPYVEQPYTELPAELPPDLDVPDPMLFIGSALSAVSNFLYEHRVAIRNTALLVGGTYVLVKAPPVAARSLAETMHYLREAWYGRGYETR